MPRFRERAETLATRLVLTHLLAHAFRGDLRLAAIFASDLQRAIDGFEFLDGWSPTDEGRAREYMRSSADEIVTPAIYASLD